MLTIYTDGGCRNNPGLGAWAIVIVKDDKVFHTTSDIKLYTTNNEMELTAILQALYYILTQPATVPASSACGSITIHSDSQYAINAITKWYPQWLSNNTLAGKKNIALIQRIYELSKTTNITFQWVKGHSTNPYNNLADQLVNQAMDKANT